MFLLASLLMAGCSQDDIAPDDGANGNGEANTSYLAVNLVSSDVMGTRAAEGYQDGIELENFVTNVRFYFFTENGAVANVKLKDNTYVNYYDWTPSQEDGNKDQSSGTNPNDDIESKLKATIVISTKSGDKLPQKIAAVLNPTGLDDNSKSLSALKDVTADYAASGLTSKGKFVMFNSVYANENKTAEICAVPITSDNLKKTEAEAKQKPVTIYVERSVAKVEVALGDNVKDAGTTKLALKDKDGNDLKVEGEQVYLTLDNWGLTAVATKGRLVKRINLTGWTSDWWNGTHRSFWAMNSSDAANDYDTYNNIKTSMSVALYTNENAAAYVNASNQTVEIEKTKVILKGTLCKSNGTPFTIVRHVGTHFADSYSETQSESLLNLKKSILDQLEITGNNYYCKEGDNFKKIAVSDLQIVTPELEEEENSENNCYVYAQLTEDAKNTTWYTSQEETAQPLNNVATVINNALKTQVDKALVWKSGMTYYYYPIKHLSNSIGVVRNHWYKTTVRSIAGLGTPVYNPDEKIYPEKPDPNEHYIAAEINILSWRIVNSDNDLEW